MLTNDDLHQLQGRLTKEKADLQKRLTELQNQDPFNDPDRLIDNASSDTEANEESTHDRYAAMIRESTLKLQEIDEALSRLQNGSYGNCANCGKPIGLDRLQAIPTAKYCVSCGSKR